MRFPSMGDVIIPSVTNNNREHFTSYEENIFAKEQAITQAKKEIAHLEEKLKATTTEIEREKINRDIFLAKIDLVEAEIAMEFLKEEKESTQPKNNYLVTETDRETSSTS